MGQVAKPKVTQNEFSLKFFNYVTKLSWKYIVKTKRHWFHVIFVQILSILLFFLTMSRQSRHFNVKLVKPVKHFRKSDLFHEMTIFFLVLGAINEFRDLFIHLSLNFKLIYNVIPPGIIHHNRFRNQRNFSRTYWAPTWSKPGFERRSKTW